MIPTAHPSTHSNGISIGSAVFAQGTAECPYTLQRDAPPPSKLLIPMGVSGPPSNTWFLVRTRVHNPNGISIGSAVFAGLTSVTDRPTDHATRSVTIGRIHVRSTAMRPNNNNGQSNLTRRKAILQWYMDGSIVSYLPGAPTCTPSNTCYLDPRESTSKQHLVLS